MNARNTNRTSALSAMLIAPDRALAAAFTNTLARTNAFQILAELKSYPSQQTLDLRLRQLKPEIVLLDVASNTEAAVELIGVISRLSPDASVVALHRESNTDAILAVLRAGATEFLHAPFDPATQSEAVTRLERMRKVEPASDGEMGAVVVFSSVKPGSGASTLATQTAFALQRLTNKRILLADLDLMGGTIGFYLKLSHSYSLVEALERSDQLDGALWNSLVVNSGGIDILAAPAGPYADSVEPSRLTTVLEHARARYEWIILDLPSVFQRVSLMTISQAERAFLVSTSELPSLHLARKAIMMLDQLGFPKDRFQLIVNRVNRKDGIGRTDMEKMFNCAVHASFPNDYFSLHRVVTLGQPLGPDGELGRAIESLAGRLSGLNGSGKKNADRAPDQKLAFSVM